MAESARPVHLDPSELGSKEYWDEYYERDLDSGGSDEEGNENAGEDDRTDEEPPDPSDLDSWFDDVGAPAKTLAFLTSTTFPLSPNYDPAQDASEFSAVKDRRGASVLDLGTGNGSALFALRLQGDYNGLMVGIDYSQRSVRLAESLRSQYASSSSMATETSTNKTKMDGIDFYEYDIINDTPQAQSWWPALSDLDGAGFDLVLDKGTLDAISLSSDTILNPTTNRQQRVCELYPLKLLPMVKQGGFLLVTSCNWTEGEIVTWFTGVAAVDGRNEGSGSGRFEIYDKIRYPVFEYGGQKGQGVASVCFRKVRLEQTAGKG